MKWSIPAKTFLLGEYSAIEGNPAILLTTKPCFELILTNSSSLEGIHPKSPAGKWWAEHGDHNYGLRWFDPYHGLGGMGASSAQFVGVYIATHELQSREYTQESLLADYFQYAWQKEGLKPSGYDVLAQMQSGCMYIYQQQSIYTSIAWPFQDVAFVLLHTGKKLATHEHLQSTGLPNDLDELISLVQQAKKALTEANSLMMVDAINGYHQALLAHNKVAAHSLQSIQDFEREPEVLAVKGCGAMGADVLLLLIATEKLAEYCNRLKREQWNILATSADLYNHPKLFTKNLNKVLDI